MLMFALAFAAAGPASALPGQSIHAFKAWAAQRKLLAGLVTQRDELSGMPAFAVAGSDHGIVALYRHERRQDDPARIARRKPSR